MKMLIGRVLMDHPVLYVIPWILLLLGHVKQVFSQTCPAPSLTTLTDNGCIQLQSIPQYTQTAGSSINYTCAGLITGLVSTYPHCPVELCKADLTWTSPSISCGTNECYNVGSSASYLGHRTCTMSGKICQRWDSQTPHSHSFTGTNFPDGTLTAASNYCRDPDGSGYPWCFTTDPLVGKESCSVLQCSTVPTNYGTCTTTSTLDPTGTTAANCGLPTLLAMTDNGCIQLQSIPPYTTTAGSIINYVCAGLLTGFVSTYAHCPEQLCQTTGLWTSPTISCGINECYTVGSSSTYQGHRTCTFSGKTCQRWDSQTPHSHSFTAVNFPDGSLALANNYCRDPDGTGNPWCYTTDTAVVRESCNVLVCTSVPVNEGTCTTATTAPTVAMTTTVTTTAIAPANCGLPTLLAMTDNGCIQLQNIPPYTTTAGSIINYVCAGLLTGFVSTYAHCPEQLCQTTGLWTSPTISCGINECYTVGSSSTYQGHRTCTFSGKTCQRWDSQTPHSHSFTAVNFPDGSLALANNYCRDPDGTGNPWCYTTDTAVVRESCNVLVCTSVPVNEGTCTTATTAPTVAMTTTVTTTAIAPATSVTTTAPNAGLSGDIATFSQRQQGIEKYTNIRNITGVRNSIKCGRECLVEVNCDLFIFDEATRICSLSQENLGEGISINCSSNNCFKRQREPLIYNTVA